MATVDLGKIKPLYKGAYASGTAYEQLDFVMYNGVLYVAKQNTTGNLPTNTLYFDPVTAEKTPTEILTAIKTVDGSGSGLDADTVDGLHIGQSGFSYIPYANSSGNVGIGTDSPVRKLEVRGSGAQEIVVGSTNGQGCRLGFDNLGQSYDYIQSTNGAIGVTTGNQERMRITSGGNVLIGTTSDNGVDKLQVNGSISVKPLTSTNPVDNGELVFELTSNTQLKIKVKGSDGVVRSASLTLA
jgi:hypothetical protein